MVGWLVVLATRLGGSSQADVLDHAQDLDAGEGTGRVEVVTAGAVHPCDQLTHVRGEVVLGGHLCCRADGRVAKHTSTDSLI